jgi:uncharacterized membrane protein
MIRFSIPVEIDRPVQDVFAFVTDPARLHEWQTNTVSARQETPGPVGEGTLLREVHRAPFGRELEQLVEVARFEPNRRFELRIVEGPLPIDGAFSFTPANGHGTRVDFEAQGEPKGALRLLEPLLARQIERQFRDHLTHLKTALETA